MRSRAENGWQGGLRVSRIKNWLDCTSLNNQYLLERSPYSFVFQIDPFRTSSGTDSTSYVDPSTAGYSTETFGANTMDDNQPLSNQVVWKYNSQSYLTLLSQWGSSAQRLPNGDTLICSTGGGYMVEVNSSSNVVGEFFGPVSNSGRRGEIAN